MSRVLEGPPYRNTNGQFFTVNLFYERQYLVVPEKRVIEPIFSLLGHPDYISFKDTFVELRDPTGYKWAMKYLKSWRHWQKLLEAAWFVEYFNEAVAELKASLKSEAVAKLIRIASEDSPQALQACKYLASAEWEKPAHNRGRPSKEEMKGELRKTIQQWSTEQEDAIRIGLVGEPHATEN